MSRALVVLLVMACNGAPRAPAKPAAPTYSATIRWTSHGIPHVVADNLGSLAFGQGYAFATHHVCVMADQRIKLRSERAKLFGPGEGGANVESDFGWLALDVRELAARGIPTLSDDSRALLRGFAAGYNRYLADTKPEALPPECAGQPWVQPLDEVDLFSHWIQISVLGSTGYFLDSIAGAQPPGGKQARVPMPDLARVDAPASNGWAIGSERSANGRGMLVANPHFPWEGELRFFESHLTIPGTLDAYGVNLLGLPLVSIGFTQSHAWTHTFSSSRRFVLYRVTLAADPTRYRYGDEERAMTKRAYAIDVRQPDGSLKRVERTLYRTHHGPVVANSQLGWTTEHAFTLRDVAGGNLGALDQYLAMARAKDRVGFEAALARWQATGFVNTIYADRDGNALYVDGSAVPDLTSPALLALGVARATIPQLRQAWDRGVAIADGSDPTFELAIDPKSARPGAIGYERAPRLLRKDFVANANDSYWLTNPAELLTGFSPLYGEAETLPSERTRMNFRYLMGTNKFTVEDLKIAILDHRAMTAELLRADVVTRCKASRAPAIARACDTLAAWDGRYDVESKGAILWRELLVAYRGIPYAEPFDAARPIETPAKLVPAPASGPDPIVEALATAVAQLERAGVDPYGTLGAAQWTEKAGKRIPVPGSGPFEGSTNPAFFSAWNTTRLPRSSQPELVNPTTGLGKGGYAINYGTSFLAVVGFGDTGPEAHAVLTYSASSDSRSPQFSDQTELYSKKQWRRVLFRDADIERDPGLRVQTVSGP
jgi:acyl-homoserine-lactone acylase